MGFGKSFSRRPGIVVALDCPLDEAKNIVDETSDLQGSGITGYKISSLTVEEYGFKEVHNTLCTHLGSGGDGYFIYDKQKGATDVPFIVKQQVELAAKYWMDAYIGSPLGAGSNEDPKGTLETFVETCFEKELVPIVVLEMTQPGAVYFSSLEQCEDLCKLSMDLGVKHFVAPATRPERITAYRKMVGSEGEIISPGSGPQKTGDVVQDAVNAINAGADHLVIGRGILKAEYPAAKTKEVYKAIREAWRKR